ncbi:NAD(P)-binding protein [Streptomyces qinzhouensis]|uniref:FAD-dependent oxidoreductase n=1 Tax=Streptomyces qinzhouensis TaxID=2599401 RepID=A0A5B8IG33_9ACTN|nr:NAD(P)-binding protein [Streptomyces qinzhouensis]QDY77518.1 FAD-dependent oxidoreductase [Streptomyces qinzhouensis]
MTDRAAHRARQRDRITVIGGGLAGLTAAISSAEAGARVTLYESHHTLGGRGRTAEEPYRTSEGPHVFYAGPLWSWLRQHDLTGPRGRVPVADTLRFRFRRGGVLRALPPRGLLRLSRIPTERAPVDASFLDWATGLVGEADARAAAHFSGVALFHHDPGALSAAFVQERVRRAAALPPQVRYPLGGWGQVIDRMVGRAWDLGVRVETSARVDELPADRGPVIVATSLAAARRLLGDDALRWTGGRTVLVDLAVRRHRKDAFVVSDLDAPGWAERFSAPSRGLVPAGASLVQAQFPIAPDEGRTAGSAHADALFDLGLPDWRERTLWRRDALAQDRTGAVDLPGTSWRDRPGIDRGDGVFLAGDQVAAPGLLGEVSFASGLTAASLALRALVKARMRT